MDKGGRGPGGVVRVLIADDQELFRRGLSAVLSAAGGLEVVGEAGNGEEAAARAAELAPHVVLMDIRMPRRDGIEAIRLIRALSPATKVLVVTVSDEECDLFDAVKAGASGYLLKEVSAEEIVAAVRAVVAGQSLIPPSMASKLLAEFASLARRAEERLPSPSLTARELEVLGLAARGMSNRDIAVALYIAENTVKNHMRNILEKLHLHSRMQAVMYAVRERLIETR
ncbi:MAG: response regulator [Acidimicrobiales bacterium]